MTEEMIKKFEEAGCKRWTKNGMDRLYINTAILGYRYERRRTGSIAWAELNGESISNSEMGRVLSYKSYIDIQTGELVAGGRDIDSEYKETVENFFKKVTKEVTEEAAEEATEEVTEEAAAEEATNTNRYHININYWKSGSGYSHSETVDNVNRILSEEELLEDYGDYGWPHCEIEQINKDGERVAGVEIPGIKTRNGFAEGKDTIVVTRLGEKEFFDSLQDACGYYNINETVETIEDFQEELERMTQINDMGPIKVKLI